VRRVVRASPVRKASSSAVAATIAVFAFYSTAPNHRYRCTGTILNKFQPMQSILARPQMGSQLARTRKFDGSRESYRRGGTDTAIWWSAKGRSN